jgi:hypothetical protein
MFKIYFDGKALIKIDGKSVEQLTTKDCKLSEKINENSP